MSSVEGRFTAHFSPAERAALRELALEEASSENYLVRLGLRALLGLPIPRHARERIREGLEPERAAAA